MGSLDSLLQKSSVVPPLSLRRPVGSLSGAMQTVAPGCSMGPGGPVSDSYSSIIPENDKAPLGSRATEPG